MKKGPQGRRTRNFVDYVFDDVNYPSDPPKPLSPAERARLEKLRELWQKYDQRKTLPAQPDTPPAQS